MEKLQLRAPGRSLVVGWGGPQLCASLLARPAPHHAQLPPAAPMIQSAVELRESASKPKRCPSVAAPSGEQRRTPSGPPVGGPAVTAQGPRRLKPPRGATHGPGCCSAPRPAGRPAARGCWAALVRPVFLGKGGRGAEGLREPGPFTLASDRERPHLPGPRTAVSLAVQSRPHLRARGALAGARFFFGTRQGLSQ